jgi:L-threonylcarbamoyladenylate synthase
MKEELNKALKTLQKKGVILYPTDTVWGIGCDATDAMAVEKIFKLKKRDESKSLVILVNSLTMLQQYIDDVSDEVRTFLKNVSKPTTVIYKNPTGLAANVIAKDTTVAIRIVQDEFCKKLIGQLQKPIVSTSANISDKPTPKTFKEIEKPILDAVDYVVNLHREKRPNIPSTIVKINNKGRVEIIRA